MSRRAIVQAIVASLTIVAVVFVAVTWWALESDGVAIVQTSSLDGTSRFTHVWYVQQQDEVWVEAGTPENGWFVDSQANPDVWVLEPTELAGRYHVETMQGPEGHRNMRRVLREKYGWRDRWVGLIFDTSRSIGVRLVRQEPSR